MKRWKFAVGALVIVLALGFLGYRAFIASASYYYEVGEFLAQQSNLGNEDVRIAGQVAPGSIEQKGLNLKFTITDGQQGIPVVYRGAVPDSFRTASDITVEGRLGPSGVFEARTLMPKCPSKYVAE